MVVKKNTVEKDKGGRPSKIDGFLVGMKEVLEEDINSIILTDEELFILANDKLEEKFRISYTTFKVYKASRNKTELAGYKVFQSLYKKALTNQKRDLFTSLKDNEGQWQKYAWIIERKFSEWNLRNINENKNEHSGEIKINNITIK